MRFLADESCDYAVIRALIAQGQDVTAVADLLPGADDESVIDLALREQCVLLTEDKDFGQLVHASGLSSVGVVLLRFPASARSTIGEAVAGLVNRTGEDLIGRFVVIQPGRIRMSPGTGRHGD